jgi:hypothetical protein
MKISSFAKHALTITMGAAALAACSNNGGSALAPSGASSGMPNITHIGRTVVVNGIPITAAHPNLISRQGGLFSPDKFLPDKKKKKQLYVYIAGNGPRVCDHPRGGLPIICFIGGQSLCTDVTYGTGKKTFWVTESTSAGAIEEFKVGGSPIKTLTAPTGDIPVGCAIDPTTGDLVATSISNGQVVIYKKASGTGTASQTPLIEAFFAGFDNKSNLYVDGFNSGGTFGFVELPNGSNSWETLSTSNSVEFPGSVQFDGTYITVGDQEAHNIYGYTCHGTSCTLKRTVTLSGSSNCDQTWIAKGYVICGTAIVKYPAGGIIAHLRAPSSGFSELSGSVQAEK